MPPRSRRSVASSQDAGDGSKVAVADPQAQQEPEGYEVGNRAPDAKYAPLVLPGPDDDRTDPYPDLSKVTSQPPKGMGVQLVAKGDVVTQAVYDQLNPKADDSE